MFPEPQAPCGSEAGRPLQGAPRTCAHPPTPPPPPLPATLRSPVLVVAPPSGGTCPPTVAAGTAGPHSSAIRGPRSWLQPATLTRLLCVSWTEALAAWPGQWEEVDCGPTGVSVLRGTPFPRPAGMARVRPNTPRGNPVKRNPGPDGRVAGGITTTNSLMQGRWGVGGSGGGGRGCMGSGSCRCPALCPSLLGMGGGGGLGRRMSLHRTVVLANRTEMGAEAWRSGGTQVPTGQERCGGATRHKPVQGGCENSHPGSAKVPRA